MSKRVQYGLEGYVSTGETRVPNEGEFVDYRGDIWTRLPGKSWDADARYPIYVQRQGFLGVDVAAPSVATPVAAVLNDKGCDD